MFFSKRKLSLVIFMTFFLALIAASAVQAQKDKFVPQSNPDIVTISGTVLEVKVKVDRMYLLLDTDKKRNRWAAVEIPEKTVNVGDVVTVEGVVMKDFHVKGMKRQFGRILFGTLVENK